LDLLVPVEASVSGVIGNEVAELTDTRLKTIRDRYKLSMAYLTSADDTPGSNGKSKVDTYVQKQSAWAREVQAYASAQAQASMFFSRKHRFFSCELSEPRTDMRAETY